MTQTMDINGRIEGVARYLGATFPAGSLDRYEDEGRNVVGFHFRGAPHADVEFERGWLASLPGDANGIAQEMHLHHVCAEINETHLGQCVVFTGGGVRRETR